MPLIPQQDIVTVRGQAGTGITTEPLISDLKKLLEKYPPVRILSITETVSKSGTGHGDYRTLTALIETV
jgi:hypothetical protein